MKIIFFNLFPSFSYPMLIQMCTLETSFQSLMLVQIEELPSFEKAYENRKSTFTIFGGCISFIHVKSLFVIAVLKILTFGK